MSTQGVVTVFYGNQVYATYNPSRDMHMDITPVNNNEVYQSGYFYWNAGNSFMDGWYRMDATPVLLCDVPKELLLLKLILNL